VEPEIEDESPPGGDLEARREAEAEFRAAFGTDQGPSPDTGLLDLEFTGELVFWRGPSPFYFVRMPEESAAAVHAVSGVASYGWGCIPVSVRIGGTAFVTSLFPKDGGYLVPVKVVVRKAERLEQGDTVPVQMAIRT
jgi:Domain of unknown function (DUF1905)